MQEIVTFLYLKRRQKLEIKFYKEDLPFFSMFFYFFYHKLIILYVVG